MTIENWAKSPGLPPVYVDVLSRAVEGCEEKLYIRGASVHLGKPHQGWTGDETLVYRRQKEDGTWKVIKPPQNL